MCILLSKTMINTFQDLTFGCIPVFVLCRMSHYIDHFSIAIQAVFFMKCNYGNFILYYINLNVIQLLIWIITTAYLYRMKKKKPTKTFGFHIIIQYTYLWNKWPANGIIYTEDMIILHELGGELFRVTTPFSSDRSIMWTITKCVLRVQPVINKGGA